MNKININKIKKSQIRNSHMKKKKCQYQEPNEVRAFSEEHIINLYKLCLQKGMNSDDCLSLTSL